jgi:hypothetical protein
VRCWEEVVDGNEEGIVGAEMTRGGAEIEGGIILKK